MGNGHLWMKISRSFGSMDVYGIGLFGDRLPTTHETFDHVATAFFGPIQVDFRNCPKH